MNILHILGNGFDLNLGLKTRFEDFYKVYLKEHSGSKIVEKLKEEISKDLSNWADLEMELGKFTIHIKNLEELDLVMNDLVKGISKYLVSEENLYDKSGLQESDLVHSICYPEDFLRESDKQEFAAFRHKWASHVWVNQLVTFNYTRILEMYLKQGQELGKNKYSRDMNIGDILHIHGYTDDRLVIGVNDISQLHNPNFITDIDVLESIVKPKCNQAHKHSLDLRFSQLIAASDLICIFGSSLGQTDIYWWRQIGIRLIEADFRLIIFELANSQGEHFQSRYKRNERSVKKLFLERAKVKEADHESCMERMYVGVNTQMFKSKVKSVIK